MERRFKTDVGAQGTRPPANLAALAGNLQEKFDRVNRKLKNWELVETAASEVRDCVPGRSLGLILVAWASSRAASVACCIPYQQS